MADFRPDIDPIHVRPSMGTYNTPKTFRFWCQKVLPLVYDDSLSYYELLCKVVDYLNKTMEDVNTAVEDVTNLNGAFGQLENHVNASETALLQAYTDLQNYVNNYFDSLDFQQAVSDKLDEMASDGTLDALLLPHFNEYVETTDAEIQEITQNMEEFVLNYVAEARGQIRDATAEMQDTLNDAIDAQDERLDSQDNIIESVQSQFNQLIALQTAGTMQGAKVTTFRAVNPLEYTTTSSDVLPYQSFSFVDHAGNQNTTPSMSVLDGLVNPRLVSAGAYVLDNQTDPVTGKCIYLNLSSTTRFYPTGGFLGADPDKRAVRFSVDYNAVDIYPALTGKWLVFEFSVLSDVPTDLSEITDARVGANGTTYQTLGDAIRTQNSILNNHIVHIENGEGTTLEPTAITTGAYINENGAVITGQGSQFVVKKYKVKENKTLRLYGKNVRLNASLPMVCFRDATDTVETNIVIKQGNNVATNYDETYTPVTDGYVYIAIVTTFGELVPFYDIKYDPYTVIKLKEQIASVKTETETAVDQTLTSRLSDVAVTSPNLFDKDNVVNGYVSTSTGNIIEGDGTWRTSDFIPVDASKKYYSATGGTVGFYDTSKAFLGYAVTALIEPVANTAYIRKSLKATNLSGCIIVEGESAPQIYYPYGYIGLSDDVLKKAVSEMTIQTFGDSMVGMGLWQASCMYRLGFKAYINNGNNGYKMCDTGDTASTPIDTVISNNLNSNADVVTIWGGTNDFYGNAVIGTPSDAVNTTFYGALNLATKYICENYPNKRIVFITPLNRFDDLSSRFSKNADDEYINAHGKTLEDYVNAMIDVCRRNSIQ